MWLLLPGYYWTVTHPAAHQACSGLTRLIESNAFPPSLSITSFSLALFNTLKGMHLSYHNPEWMASSGHPVFFWLFCHLSCQHVLNFSCFHSYHRFSSTMMNYRVRVVLDFLGLFSNLILLTWLRTHLRQFLTHSMMMIRKRYLLIFTFNMIKFVILLVFILN